MPLRRPVPRWAWPLVFGGWLLLLAAAAAMLWLSDLYGIAALAGLTGVGIGSYLLGGRAVPLAVAGTMIGGFFLFTGLAIGSEALAKNLWGETATCHVTGVEKGTYTTSRRSEQSGGGYETKIETRTRYTHDVRCPGGAYRLGADHPFSVGERVEVLFDPHRHLPEFTFGQRHQDLTFSVVLLSVSGPAILLLPFIAWRVGRRRAELDPLPPPLPPLPPPLPPTAGTQPYQTWQPALQPAQAQAKPPRRRRPAGQWGWPLVVMGWVVLPAAGAATLLLSAGYVFALIPGAVLVGCGSYFLSGGRAPLIVPITMIGAFALFLGVLTGADALANSLWGTTTTCQVSRIEQELTRTTTRDSRGRETTSTRTYFAHKTTCADGTYWLNASRPFAVGTRVEVRYDPRSQRPRFAADDPGEELRFGAVLLLIGGSSLLLLPVIAWRVGRRRTIPPLPPPSAGPPSRPGQAARSEPLSTASPELESPELESPDYEPALRKAAGFQPMSPNALFLSLIVRLARRRAGK